MADQDAPEEHEESKEVHGRLALPLLIPAVVFLFAVLTIYGLSRIYLELDTFHVGDVSMATPLAIGVSLVILVIATYLASQRTISVFQVGGIFLVSAALLTAGGVWAAVHEESTGAHDEPVENGNGPTPEGIQVGLNDPSYSVSAEPDSAQPGEVTFVANNEGTQIHNLRVVQFDDAPGALPYDEDLLEVDEAALDILAETDQIPAEATETVAVSLDAGSYVLFCNIPGHYEQGMFLTFTVE